MVIVFLKNGEKAPLPDANFVKLETPPGAGETMLRCYFGEREVGQFKWTEVAGYSLDVLTQTGASSPEAYEAWTRRMPEQDAA